MPAKKAQVPPKNFEDALAELERILGEIEGGEVPLEESLVKYERGQFLIQHCRGVLSAAEKQIELLSKSQGNNDALVAEPTPQTNEAREDASAAEDDDR